LPAALGLRRSRRICRRRSDRAGHEGVAGSVRAAPVTKGLLAALGPRRSRGSCRRRLRCTNSFGRYAAGDFVNCSDWLYQGAFLFMTCQYSTVVRKNTNLQKSSQYLG
jgi:hypothetical protein